ncbi:MAG: hypothetical protein JNK02_09620 [Planctomycetes bacterium]|nr:hypothetical protein [Planctomycetota bacterium]
MSTPARPAPAAPTADELLAMAYADGELAPTARAEFEARLAREAPLRVLVAEQQRIAVIAREAAPAEPLELAELRVARAASQVGLWLAGLGLLVLALLWVLAWLVLAGVEGAPRPPLVVAAIAGPLGFGLLVARALLARRATLHLDPYRDLRR